MKKNITPETYEEMNKEFEKEGMDFRICVPTQDEIDEWLASSKKYGRDRG